MTLLWVRLRDNGLFYPQLGLEMSSCNMFFRNCFVEVSTESLGGNFLGYCYCPSDTKETSLNEKKTFHPLGSNQNKNNDNMWNKATPTGKRKKEKLIGSMKITKQYVNGERVNGLLLAILGQQRLLENN
jgi:hypothetical protein